MIGGIHVDRRMDVETQGQKLFFYNEALPGIETHACNPRTWEAEARGGLRPTWATDLPQKGLKKDNNGNINFYTLVEKRT
jgi:hypothetical protein